MACGRFTTSTKKARDFASTIPGSTAADFILKLAEEVRRLRHNNLQARRKIAEYQEAEEQRERKKREDMARGLKV